MRSGGAASFVEFFIEAQIHGSKVLGNVRNLAKGEAEVVHDMVDRVQSAGLAALNFVGREQLVRGEPIEDSCRFVQGGA